MNTIKNAQALEKVKQKFVADTQQAKYMNALNSCSPLEQEIVKTLKLLDEQSGGKLDYLVSVYKAIKQNN